MFVGILWKKTYKTESLCCIDIGKWRIYLYWERFIIMSIRSYWFNVDSQLVPSIQSLIFIELFPSFDIYFVPGSGLCISICCQNLWFSDKNCILKQFEEKLLKLHFTVCQMMFYKRMNLCVLREFCFYSVIIKFPLRYSLDVKCKNVK